MSSMKDVFIESDPRGVPRDHDFSSEDRAMLKRIVDLIRKTAPMVKKIELFGSRARNDYHADSDYDVFAHIGNTEGPNVMPGVENYWQDKLSKAFAKEFPNDEAQVMVVCDKDLKAKHKPEQEEDGIDWIRPDGEHSFYATVKHGGKFPVKQIYP